MSNSTMVGCDLHDVWMVWMVAVDAGKPIRKRFRTAHLKEGIAWLKAFAEERGSERISFAYEASGLGFGLHDSLVDAGIECFVLAPTAMPRSRKQAKNKTDDRDAMMVLDELRAHKLAGRKLCDVWVPSLKIRDDREVVRFRLEAGESRTRIKNQIRSLAKRCGVQFPQWFTSSGEWSRRSVEWLRTTKAFREGSRRVLDHLVNIYDSITAELKALDKEVNELSRTPAYSQACRKLLLLKGVGRLTAMVFLTEMGDLTRFSNRRQVGAYLGLVPSAHESGERDDRKGPITRQGPARVRQVLCQAAWAAVRWDEARRAKFNRIKRGSQKRSKTAIVAIMRQMAVQMWHVAQSKELDEALPPLNAEAA